VGEGAPRYPEENPPITGKGVGREFEVGKAGVRERPRARVASKEQAKAIVGKKFFV